MTLFKGKRNENGRFLKLWILKSPGILHPLCSEESLIKNEKEKEEEEERKKERENTLSRASSSNKAFSLSLDKLRRPSVCRIP